MPVKFQNWPMLQTALRACHANAFDLKEVHFMLFGSDTYNTWIAEIERLRLEPVTSSEQGEALHASKECRMQAGVLIHVTQGCIVHPCATILSA